MSSVFLYRARPGRVIDGDTLEVVVDLGFYVEHRIRVRLDGIDTPEIFRGDAAERGRGGLAKSFVQGWLDQAAEAPSSWPLIVSTDKGKSFDRWVGTVEDLDGRDLVADIWAFMARHGWAEAEGRPTE